MPFGGYGSVCFNGDFAIKQTALFDKNGFIMGCNLNEAVISATPRNLPNVMQPTKVSVSSDMTHRRLGLWNCNVSGATVEVTMEKGKITLADFIRTTPFMARMAMFSKVLEDLVIGLHHLHKDAGMVHCDMKPMNVVLLPNGNWTIIDFGSCRHYKRCVLGGSALCTYPFASPEVLDGMKQSTRTAIDLSPAIDAYSLGATLYYYIFKGYLYNTEKFKNPRDILEAMKSEATWGGAPIECPNGCPQWAFDIVIGLIEKNPAKRISITTLYDMVAAMTLNSDNVNNNNKVIVEKTNAKAAFVIMDPLTPPSASIAKRDRAVEHIHDLCNSHGTLECFALAVNIMDRYATSRRQSKNSSVKTKHMFNRSELETFKTLAELTMYPDTDVAPVQWTRTLLIDIVTTLGFKLYADTVDYLLVEKLRHSEVDYILLKDALVQGDGSTDKVLELYLGYKDFIDLLCDDTI
jgi:serine/threonine protein kinase